MLKGLGVIIKKLVLGFTILYGYNLIGSQFNCIIPINIITIVLVSILGTPALMSLIFMFLVIF